MVSTSCRVPVPGPRFRSCTARVIPWTCRCVGGSGSALRVLETVVGAGCGCGGACERGSSFLVQPSGDTATRTSTLEHIRTIFIFNIPDLLSRQLYKSSCGTAPTRAAPNNLLFLLASGRASDPLDDECGVALVVARKRRVVAAPGLETPV